MVVLTLHVVPQVVVVMVLKTVKTLLPVCADHYCLQDLTFVCVFRELCVLAMLIVVIVSPSPGVFFFHDLTSIHWVQFLCPLMSSVGYRYFAAHHRCCVFPMSNCRTVDSQLGSGLSWELLSDQVRMDDQGLLRLSFLLLN